jgi:hypothetical protein
MICIIVIKKEKETEQSKIGEHNFFLLKPITATNNNATQCKKLHPFAVDLDFFFFEFTNLVQLYNNFLIKYSIAISVVKLFSTTRINIKK